MFLEEEMDVFSEFSRGKIPFSSEIFAIFGRFPSRNGLFRRKNEKKCIYPAFFFGQRPRNGYTL